LFINLTPFHPEKFVIFQGTRILYGNLTLLAPLSDVLLRNSFLFYFKGELKRGFAFLTYNYFPLPLEGKGDKGGWGQC
jgi:hypothetical protein